MQQGSGGSAMQGELFEDAAWSRTDMSDSRAERRESARGGAMDHRALTDEEILGIGTEEEFVGAGPGVSRDTEKSGRPQSAPPRGDEEQARAPRAGEPGEGPPDWMQPLLADAKVAPQLHALWNEHRSLRAIDAAYYGDDARSQADLARQLYADNPAAFRRMVEQGERLLAELGGASPLQRASHTGAGNGGGETAHREDSGAREDRPEGREASPFGKEREELERARGEFRAEQFAAFQQSANDAVVQDVRQSIERVVSEALAEDASDGARQRIAADIYAEVERTLQGDRALTERVAALLRPADPTGRQWRFDDATKQQVVNLIFGRARAVLPSVAKRVIGEWTSSVLSTRRQKIEKQQAAARRVDIVGGGAMESQGQRGLSPRDIDYARTSDDAILNL